MAILMSNPDGTSNAKVGDYVVTGGGIYYKDTSGSIKVSDLSDYIGKAVTGSKLDVAKAYQSVINSGKYGANASVNTIVVNKTEETTKPTVFDTEENYDDFTSGITYDPQAAVSGNIPNYNSSTSSTTLTNVVGYAIVGLVLVAVLDRLMK